MMEGTKGMMEGTKCVVQYTYETATIYTLVLVVVYALSRSSDTPLMYRTPIADWDDLKHLLGRDGASGTSKSYNYRDTTVANNKTILVGLKAFWQDVAALACCPEITTSPLCVCLYNFYQNPYQQNILTAVASNSPIFIDNVTDSCRWAHPSGAAREIANLKAWCLFSLLASGPRNQDERQYWRLAGRLEKEEGLAARLAFQASISRSSW